MRRALILLGISALGIAVGAFSLDVARDDPGFWFAGQSATGDVALLCAGWAAIAGGLALWLRRPRSHSGPLLAAAGFAWFLLEWNNPGIGSPLAFTIGLALYMACPPLVAHAVLASTRSRLGSQLDRGLLFVAYSGGVLVLGLLPALFFDSQAAGCTQCPRNLLLTADHLSAFERLNRTGVYLGFAWALALAALATLRTVQASRAARPLIAAGAVYLALVAGLFGASLDRGFVTNGTLERRLWFGQAAALAAIALASAWSWMRARRARSAVAQLVVELAQAAPSAGLRDVLSRIVGDPELVLAYPLEGSGRLVDAGGRPVELSDRQAQTSLIRAERPVAVLAHAPGLLDDEQLVDDVTAAARLALENERLQAEVRARLEELRVSRARIVETGDAERKRLERDLHDGAQQRLVGLSLSLRLLRSQLSPPVERDVATRLDEADSELRIAIQSLRELAQGIFPAVLADEGLAAAVEALAEDVHVPIRIRRLPQGRFAASVETAAYTVVAAVARAATTGIVVEADDSSGVLVVEVEAHDAADSLELVELEDRVGAVDGRFAVVPAENGGVRIRAELPCGS